jgi:hypothetical protein
VCCLLYLTCLMCAACFTLPVWCVLLALPYLSDVCCSLCLTCLMCAARFNLPVWCVLLALPYLSDVYCSLYPTSYLQASACGKQAMSLWIIFTKCSPLLAVLTALPLQNAVRSWQYSLLSHYKVLLC